MSFLRPARFVFNCVSQVPVLIPGATKKYGAKYGSHRRQPAGARAMRKPPVAWMRGLMAKYRKEARVRSIPAREQRQVDCGVVGEHPTLEYDAARARDFKAIAVRCGSTRICSQVTVWPVEHHKFSQIGEQRRRLHHSMMPT